MGWLSGTTAHHHDSQGVPRCLGCEVMAVAAGLRIIKKNGVLACQPIWKTFFLFTIITMIIIDEIWQPSYSRNREKYSYHSCSRK